MQERVYVGVYLGVREYICMYVGTCVCVHMYVCRYAGVHRYIGM